MFNCSSNYSFNSFYFSRPEELSVPRRVFCSVGMSGPVSICDYQFNDEEDCDVTDRLKEMLDIIITKDNLDTMQETLTEIREREILAGKKTMCFCTMTWLMNVVTK